MFLRISVLVARNVVTLSLMEAQVPPILSPVPLKPNYDILVSAGFLAREESSVTANVVSCLSAITQAARTGSRAFALHMACSSPKERGFQCMTWGLFHRAIASLGLALRI